MENIEQIAACPRLQTFVDLYNQRPENYKLMVDMSVLQLSKGHDYSTDDLSGLGNLRECEKIGIPAWKGVLTRMGDKWTRICGFARRATLKVSDETIEDTLMDLAVYCLLCIIAYRFHVMGRDTEQLGAKPVQFQEREPAVIREASGCNVKDPLPPALRTRYDQLQVSALKESHRGELGNG